MHFSYTLFLPLAFTNSSVSDLVSRITSVVLPVAQTYNLTLVSFGSTVHNGTAGKGAIVLSDAWATALEPAPRTPTDAETDGDVRPYDVLMGTIKAALGASPAYEDREVVVIPTLGFGNTGALSFSRLLEGGG
jgi:Gly-Xaa carboxypeptidase